jgi:hypothetical protein
VSGGSHNYMHSRVPDDIRSIADEVEGMAKSLRETGFPFCADETMAVAKNLRAAQQLAEQFADLWHHQEWLDSGDWGKGPVRREAIKLGEPLPPCQHTATHRAYGYPGGEGPDARTLGEFDNCDECGEALNFKARP